MGAKFFIGCLKFLFVYFLFGVFAVIIIYASADVLHIVRNGSSYLRVIFSQPVSEAYAGEAVLYFMSTAFRSLPFTTFFNESMGLLLDGAGGNIFKMLYSVAYDLQGFINDLRNYVKNVQTFLRDMAVATLASFVFFAVVDLKDKVLKSRSISATLGFAFASIFWIFAGYTFGECLVTVLETLIVQDTMQRALPLYVVLILLAVGLETLIHAFSKKCTIHRLLIFTAVKIVFNILKAWLAWLMYMELAQILVFINPMIYVSVLLIAALFFFMALVENKLSKWSELGV